MVCVCVCADSTIFLLQSLLYAFYSALLYCALYLLITMRVFRVYIDTFPFLVRRVSSSYLLLPVKQSVIAWSLSSAVRFRLFPSISDVDAGRPTLSMSL